MVTVSTKRTGNVVSMLLVLTGLVIGVTLPGLPASWMIGSANTAGTPGRARQLFPSGLNSERQAAMEKLYGRFKTGDRFSEEEGNILRGFGAGGAVTDLEADLVISRALYDYYIAGQELTKDQQKLLDKYLLFVSRRSKDVADLKTQLLNKRIAAQAAAGPRTTPLAPPSNDLCGGAAVVPAAGPFPYLTATTADITDATSSGDPPLPSCQNSVSRSIWYTFTPAATATYTISSCADAPTATTVDDTVMAIYTSTGGCAGPFTELPNVGVTHGCDDDSCFSEALQAVITTQLNAATQYFIVVWELGTPPPTSGNTAVQLRVSQALPPANDSCSSPAVLLLNTPVNGTTAGAANDYQLSGAACFTGVGQTASTAPGRDVVYSFTAPSAGNYSFRVTNYNTLSNLVLFVATTCPAGSPPITVGTCLAAANRSTVSTAEEVSCVALSSGQQVFVFVDENIATVGGSTFTIEVNRCTLETEPNDTPATANVPSFGIEGSINPAGDADFFTLGTLAAGSRVFALLDGVAGNSDNQADFDLRVTTSTDTLEYDDSNAAAAFGSLAPNVAGTPATGTQTFIRVNHNYANPLPPGPPPLPPPIAAEPYRLYAVVQPPGANPMAGCPAVMTSATNETEPNNTIAQANSAANNYFYGSLPGPSPSGDADLYSFTATAGDLIFLSLDGDPCRNNTPLNGALELEDSSGATLIAVDDTSGSTSSTTSGAGSLTAITPFSPSEALVWRATTTGTYYAKVFTLSSSPTTGAGDYLLSISRNGQAGPTLARFNNDPSSAASAIRYDDGVSIRWQTGFEIDNLGFNVYREEKGKRVRVNSRIIAGSAMTVGAGTALAAGRAYAWFDNARSSRDAHYWIEALDLNGESTWVGPVITHPPTATSAVADQATSPTLEQLGKSPPLETQSAPAERTVSVSRVALSAGGVQPLISGPAVKLIVKHEGFYRVTQPELVTAGFDPDVDPRTFRLLADGQEQAINVIAKGRFDSSAAIEFYGVGIDSAATDEHVYWLVSGAEAGKRIQQVSKAGMPGGVRNFRSTVELKQRTVYFSALRNGEKENFFGAVIARDSVNQLLTLQHVDEASTDEASLEVALQGVTVTSHRVEVQINGARTGELSFSGQEAAVGRFAFAQSLLKEGTNLVRLTAVGGASDISLVDSIRVSYGHTLTADNDQLRLDVSSKQSVRIEGFSDASIRVFDITDVSAPREIMGRVQPSKRAYSVAFVVPGRGLKTLLALTEQTASRVSAIRLDHPSKWRRPGNAADLVIFTRPEFMMPLQELKALRESEGYRVLIVDIEDVYDEFTYGNKTPQAIKDFLAYARGAWRVAPRFVLLAGDASYDPKNYLGFGASDLAPAGMIDTQLMETASDDWLADFDGDGLAEMAVGRLPIRSAREAASVVAKIVGYQRAAPTVGVLLVTDDRDNSTEFEAVTGELLSLIPNSQRVEQINRGAEAAAARKELIEAISRGQKVVNYNGHGNLDSWRGNLLTARDASLLGNDNNLSLFVMMTCLNGYFCDAQFDSLGESLLRAENGGAVAVWASSAMSLASDQGVMDVALFRCLFDQGGTWTLGEAALKAKAAAVNVDTRLTWILMGDPTTRVR